MKKSILSISVFSFILFVFMLQGCRKQPKHPQDPCKKPFTVMAVEKEYHYWGHFRMTNPDNSDVYLYANNWNQYASKVIPGRQYRIGYREVPCKDNEGCGDKMYGIREGGCIVYPKKCIMILCLEEFRKGCFETLVNPFDYDDMHSQAISSTGISGNSLNATVGFSGCSPDQANFKLYAEQVPVMSPIDVWNVKAVNMDRGITCQAYFTKDVCFDLSAIKNHYKLMNTIPPANVRIRLLIGSEYKEFTYSF